MSKNMTRKGLALSAAAALVVSGFVSTSAQASEILTLAPSAGTGYSTLSGSTFTLNAGLPSSVPAGSYPFLKFRVQNDSLTEVNADQFELTGSTRTHGADNSVQYGTATAAAGGGTNDTVEITDDDFVIVPIGDSILGIGATGQLDLAIGNGDAASYSVTAWLDVNGNNTIDSGESFSPTEVVSFVKASTVTATPTIVSPLAGDGTLKARVAFSNANINVRQIASEAVLVQFGTVSGSTFTAINSFADAADGSGNVTNATTVTSKISVKSNNAGNNVVYNSSDGVYEAVFTPSATTKTAGGAVLSAAANTTFGAQLALDQDDDGTTAISEVEGLVVTTKTAVAATDYSVKWNVIGSADAITTAVGFEDAGSGGAAAGYVDNQAMAASVRADSSSSSGFTFEVFVGTDATTPVAIKSVPVKVTISSNSALTLADAVTVDGLSVYDGKTRAITKSTDTSGKVTFTVAAGKADAGDRLDFVLSVNGTAPGANVNSADGSVTFAAANYEIYAADDLSGNAGLSIASGDSYSVDYVVVDQFGTAPSNGKYRVVGTDLASSNSERTTAADFAVATPVVDGKATLTIADNGVGTGRYTLQAGWATVDGQISASGDDFVNTVVRVVADATASKVTLDDLVYGSAQLTDANGDGDYTDTGDIDNRKKLVLETKSLYTYIANTATATESVPTLTSNIEVTLAGTVTNAAATAIAYAPVTIAAPGLLFKTGSNYVVDSITLYADSSGEFSVDVYSASGGINNITITSGAASAAQSLTYAGAVAGAARDFTITTPGASEPGRTVDVIVSVVDKNGNGVQGATVTLSSTGPGYLINTSGTSLKDGTFTTKLLLGANDTGTAEVKATVTIVNDEISKSSKIVVGVGAVAEADQKVNAGSFKGYVAVYAKGYEGKRLSAKIGNDWVIVPSLASNFERITDFTGAGVNISVRIYIDRVLTETIPLVTK